MNVLNAFISNFVVQLLVIYDNIVKKTISKRIEVYYDCYNL